MRLRIALINAIAFLLAWIVFPVHQANAANPYPQYIPQDFLLFWPQPTRAYPGIPLDFRFVVYEINNETLSWSLSGAPSGMTINSEGRVQWTPTSGQSGQTFNVTATASRPSGGSVQRAFSISVNTSDFVFVSTSGNDSNAGTLSAPYRTILKALQSIQSGNGKTIYVRGGTYTEVYNWEVGGVVSPLTNKTFTQTDPLVIRSYPGETAVLQSSNYGGHGFMFYSTAYVLLSNFTIDKTSRGVIIQSDNVVVSDVIVHGTRGSYTNNVTGFQVATDNAVIDHCTGYDNRDINADSWNSSNFLIYNDGSNVSTLYLMNSKSWDSIVGFKIKHAGPRKVIMHGLESFNDVYSFGVGSEYSSLRYSISYNATYGAYMGIADPNSYTDDGVLIANNTFVNDHDTAVFIQGGYSLSSASQIQRNIIFNSVDAPGSGASQKLLAFWIWDSGVDARPLTSNNNVLYATTPTGTIRWGATNKSFSQWQTSGKDSNSVFANPAFSNVSSGDLSIASNSPANLSGGYAGAFVPGRTYPRVGVQSTDAAPSPPTGLRVVP